MAQLVKSYPKAPHKNRIVWSGDLETMKAHLNEIEARIKLQQFSKCGTVFTEYERIDSFTLNTCVKNDEESIDVNYLVIK